MARARLGSARHRVAQSSGTRPVPRLPASALAGRSAPRPGEASCHARPGGSRGTGGDGPRRRRAPARADRRRRGDPLRGSRARRRLAALPLRAADRGLRPRPRRRAARARLLRRRLRGARAAGLAGAYLERMGIGVPEEPRQRAELAGLAFLCRLWIGSTDFSLEERTSRPRSTSSRPAATSRTARSR